MFSKLFLVVLLLISPMVYADDFIRTDAWGKTEAEARHAAFIKAIELKVGVLMLSDRDTKNYEQVKNDIYAYSSGYITDYKIISVNPEDDGVRVIVDSKVSSSKIKNRILIASNSTSINGDVAAASFDTYKHSKDSADDLLRKVLLNYPNNAYIVSPMKLNVNSSNNREPEIDIDFSIELKPDFIKSLVETLDVIENPNIKEYSSKIVIDNTELIQIFNHQNKYYLDDNITQEVLYKYLVPRNTRMQISLEGDNGILYTTCRSVATLVGMDRGTITFYAGQKKYYGTQVKVTSEVIRNVTDVRLFVVNAKDCKNE
jgi:hypothetical protein